MAWTPPQDFTNGEVVTHTKLNANLRDNMKEVWRELAYVEFTADVTFAGAGIDIVSSGAITYTAEPILIEFFCPRIAVNEDATTTIRLFDGASDLGVIGVTQLVDPGAGSKTFDWPVFGARRLTPTAASHTYKIRGFSTGAVAHAGAGGAATDLPGYIRVLQKGGA